MGTPGGDRHWPAARHIDGVAQRYYKGVDFPLVLLTIDPEFVDAEIRVENGYPHIYGPLHTSAVVNVEPFFNVT